MWPELERSNTVAYKAAEDVIARLHTPEGREDFHTLSWLEYAHLMLGKFDDAKKMSSWRSRPWTQPRQCRHRAELPRDARSLHPRNAAVGEDSSRSRRSRGSAIGRWRTSTCPACPECLPPPTMPPAITRMARGYLSQDSAPQRWATPQRPIRLRPSSMPWRSEPHRALMPTRPSHSRSWKRKFKPPPNGPGTKGRRRAPGEGSGRCRGDDVRALGAAGSDQTAMELYGEMLLDAGQPAQAAAAFEKSLERTPNRTPLVKDMAQASGSARN